jgi:hypothetical protein
MEERYQTTQISLNPIGQRIRHKPDLKIHFYSSYNSSKMTGVAAAKQPLDYSMMMSNHLTNCPFTISNHQDMYNCK